MDELIKTAMSLTSRTPSTDALWKSVLESKAIHEIGPVVDSKQYRQGSQKMKNALEQVRPNAIHALDAVEQMSEEEVLSTKQRCTFNNYKDAIIAEGAHTNCNANKSEVFQTVNVDMWALLSAKA